MIDVRGNNHSPGGYFAAYQFGRELLFPRDVFHFFRDDAAARIVHLGKVQIAALLCFITTTEQPFGPRLRDLVTVQHLRSCASVLCVHWSSLPEQKIIRSFAGWDDCDTALDI